MVRIVHIVYSLCNHFISDFIVFNLIAECTPEEAFSIVGDHIVFASGSPFPDAILGMPCLQVLPVAFIRLCTYFLFYKTKEMHMDTIDPSLLPQQLKSLNCGYAFYFSRAYKK